MFSLNSCNKNRSHVAQNSVLDVAEPTKEVTKDMTEIISTNTTILMMYKNHQHEHHHPHDVPHHDHQHEHQHHHDVRPASVSCHTMPSRLTAVPGSQGPNLEKIY